MWITIAIILVALVAGILLSKIKTPQSEEQVGTAPEVLDGRDMYRAYGTVWEDDPVDCAFLQVDTIPIKGKSK